MPVAGGIVFRDVVHGEHLIRVEELGHAAWGAVVPFGQPAQDIAIPPRAPLGLDDATAAAHARRMGARFALVAGAEGRRARAHRVAPDRHRPAQERDAVLLVAAGSETGMLDSGVMRLDETARRLAQADAQAGTPGAGRGRHRAPTSLPPVLLARPADEGEASARIRPPGRAITGRC